MIHEVIRLRDVFPNLPTRQDPTLTTYCPDNYEAIDPTRRRASILICPGGAYAFTTEREGEPVALYFMGKGYNCFVLHYSVAPERYPAALLEASAAMALIRMRAEKYHVDPGKIAVCGFSAGGHLAASLGTLYGEPFIHALLGIDEGINRPDAMILGYAVITSGEKANHDSINNLLGGDAPESLKAALSLERRVHDNVPPAFIWHTADDPAVPVENALMFAAALRQQNIPFELHVYPAGPHGLSLCSIDSAHRPEHINPYCASWAEFCDKWLKLTFGL